MLFASFILCPIGFQTANAQKGVLPDLSHFSAPSKALYVVNQERLAEIKMQSDSKVNNIEIKIGSENSPQIQTTPIEKTQFFSGLIRINLNQAILLETQLKELGISIGSKIGNIWSVHIPDYSLESFAKIRSIESVELDQPAYPNLDQVRADVGIDPIHKGEGFKAPFKGKNVIMGVIDGGFDARHPAFRLKDGTSRISRWWNFLDTLGTPPQEFNYASEYKTSEKIISVGTDATSDYHGTHVTGICAGSGDETTQGKYVGMAPESEIVWVSIPYGRNKKYYKSSVADGLKYIYDYAESVGKPCVINNSFGYFFGPHDGTDLLSEVANQLTGKGKVLVASGGNNGDTRSHIKKLFEGESVDDTLRTVMTTREYGYDNINYITGADVWGNPNSDMQIGIAFWSRKDKKVIDSTLRFFNTASPAEKYNPKLPNNPNTTVVFSSSLPNAGANKKPNLSFSINYYDGNVNYYPILYVTTKKENGKSIPNTIEMWQPYNYYGCEFQNNVDRIPMQGFILGDSISNMSATHCNATGVIAVASYTTTNQFTNESDEDMYFENEIGDLAYYSSRGPSADGRTKPDISAPGNWVIAPGSSLAPDFNYRLVIKHVDFLGDEYPYVALTGTSMAGPVVAGTVALMLEATPTLTPASTLEILKRTARKDEYTGQIPEAGSNFWGWGKLNALEAFKAAYSISSIESITSIEGLRIYPNPSNKYFTIDFSETQFSGNEFQLEVLDLKGQLIFSGKSSSDQLTIQTGNWNKGIYLCKILNDNRSLTLQKIIVE